MKTEESKMYTAHSGVESPVEALRRAIQTDDNAKVFTSRERWQEYWNSLDEWPREIDSEAAQGGAK